jgi:hypothetical protein
MLEADRGLEGTGHVVGIFFVGEGPHRLDHGVV